MSSERIWVLADDRPGNVAQCVGVAEALGEPFKIFDVRYNRWGALHNLVRWDSRRGLTRACRKELEPPWPELVIGAGRRTAPLSRWFKRKFGSKLVQIMDPGWPGRNDFDLIAAPRHDDMAEAPNVIHTMGSCHRARPDRLAAEAAIWAERLGDLPRPYVALVVGGTTKDYPFGLEMASLLIDQTIALAKSMGATILATTSRRTGAAIEALLSDKLPLHSHLHIWREGTENPYMGFLGLADAIVVTGDSMNMCSEASANGGPVFIFSPPGLVNEKHARLHHLLVELGYARMLGDDPTPWRHPPLNAALDVAQAVRQRHLLRHR